MSKQYSAEELLSPEYALWFFDVMLWAEELDEEQLEAIGTSLTRLWIGFGEE